jgi:protein transport protein YIF1
MDIELGKEALKSGGNYVSNRINRLNINFLRSYFNIDNRYIFKKMLMIIFPYSKGQWDFDIESRINNPDLYIPVMSFFTYILVRGMYYGLQGTFTPEKIGLIFTRLVFTESILSLLLKAIAYFMNINTKIVDMLAYSGYKYFTILLLQLIPRIRFISLLITFYSYTSFFFFLSRSLKNGFLKEFSSNRSKKIYFIFGFVFLQIIFVFLLS